MNIRRIDKASSATLGRTLILKDESFMKKIRLIFYTFIKFILFNKNKKKYILFSESKY